MARRPDGTHERPTKQQILAYIEESPARVGKREISRAFQLRSEDRVWLKDILRELEDEGHLERRRGRRVVKAGRLPEVAVIEVIRIDEDGELIARPIAWHDEDIPPPTIYLAPSGHKRVSAGVGDRVLARLARIDDRTYEAKAMRLLGPTARSLLGVFELDADGNGLLQPTDRKHRYPYAVGRDHTGNARPGDYVIAEALPGGLRTHRARIVERIGASDDPRAISLVAIHTHGLPVAFPEAALRQATTVPPAELGDREDLRTVPLVTIDGADARDFDDAVFAEPDPDGGNAGGWRLIVAIADVGWYVRHDDPLDRAARERGNSAYFPDRVVPMLPERLSNDLCSLRPGEDRACLAAEMWIDAGGNLLRHRFTRGLMRSTARLTYDQVQAARDGLPDDKTRPLTNHVIEPLYGAYAALNRAREARGTLDLDIPERQVLLREDGWIDRIVPRARFDSHRLIEEFMITANVAAAETLAARRSPVMYRIHEPPPMGDLESLRESLAALGFKLARAGTIRPHHFAGILEQAAKTDKMHIVSDLILRAQSKAVYGPEDKGHFGLSLRRYSHFTSPIRRYADLLVHRSLIRALHLGEGGLPPEADDSFDALGEQISQTERRAAAAERDALDRFTTAFLADRVGSVFGARINGVTRFGLFLTLDETGADGFVPVRTLPFDRYVHDDRLHRLVGEAAGVAFTLGEHVSARLIEAEPRTGSLIFEVVDGGTRSGGRKPRARPAGRAPKHRRKTRKRP